MRIVLNLAMLTQDIKADLVLASNSDLLPLADLLESKGMWALQCKKRGDELWKAIFETEFQHDEPEANVEDVLNIAFGMEMPNPVTSSSRGKNATQRTTRRGDRARIRRRRVHSSMRSGSDPTMPRRSNVRNELGVRSNL